MSKKCVYRQNYESHYPTESGGKLHVAIKFIFCNIVVRGSVRKHLICYLRKSESRCGLATLPPAPPPLLPRYMSQGASFSGSTLPPPPSPPPSLATRIPKKRGEGSSSSVSSVSVSASVPSRRSSSVLFSTADGRADGRTRAAPDPHTVRTHIMICKAGRRDGGKRELEKASSSPPPSPSSPVNKIRS